MPWSPRVNSCELPITTRAISANASVVSDRYGPLSLSTSLPSTQPSSAVLTTAAGMPMASGTCQ